MSAGRLQSLRSLRRDVHDELVAASLIAFGRTAPNPPVAAVLLVVRSDGADVALISGATEPPGSRHAEIVALDHFDALAENSSARVPRMFVTLEPCSHHGRTPPCSDRILQYPQLKRLRVFAADPALSKSGASLLREAGRRVALGPSPIGDAAFFLRGFLDRIVGRGPRLHLKVAVTADGYIGLRRRRLRISSPAGLRVGMILRAKLDAVVVGPRTIAADRPGLELRFEAGLVGTLTMRKIDGADPFWDGLLLSRETVEAALLANPRSYQPARVFLCGRHFEELSEFLQKQADLAVATGREAICGALPGHAESPGLPQPVDRLPDLEDAGFAAAFRRFLAVQGWNEVLVEGGAGLFHALQQGLTGEDRIYVLRSRRTLADLAPDAAALPEEERVRLPDFFESRTTSCARYDLGDDLLEMRRMNS